MGTVGSQVLELVPCRCRSRFCDRCCVGLGLELRGRVQPVLHKFRGLLMVTLTIDPEIFAGDPVKGFEYCREHRVIGEFVRRLKAAGVVDSGRYFCVVEWQKESEFPHFHVCLDAGFIEFETLCKAWNATGPGGLGRMMLRRTGFGSVRFTKKSGFETRAHAVHYLMKYLIKTPEWGFPAWVLDYKGNVVRYQVSKGFFGGESKVVVNKKEPGKERKRRATIRERIGECCKRCMVMAESEVMMPDGELRKRIEFLWSVPGTMEECVVGLGKKWDGYESVRVEGSEVMALVRGRGDEWDEGPSEMDLVDSQGRV